jgi:hypothetical protein
MRAFTLFPARTSIQNWTLRNNLGGMGNLGKSFRLFLTISGFGCIFRVPPDFGELSRAVSPPAESPASYPTSADEDIGGTRPIIPLVARLRFTASRSARIPPVSRVL